MLAPLPILCYFSSVPSKIAQRKLRITYVKHYENRHDYRLRPAQCGQIQPDQRTGRRKSGHCFQQGPNYPEPDLRHCEPGGHSVHPAGHPGSAQAQVRLGGLYGESGHLKSGGRGLRVAAGGADSPCGRPGKGADRAHPGGENPLHPLHQQNRHRGAGGSAAGDCRLQRGVGRL